MLQRTSAGITKLKEDAQHEAPEIEVQSLHPSSSQNNLMEVEEDTGSQKVEKVNAEPQILGSAITADQNEWLEHTMETRRTDISCEGGMPGDRTPNMERKR